jgi:hypothetical protein
MMEWAAAVKATSIRFEVFTNHRSFGGLHDLASALSAMSPHGLAQAIRRCLGRPRRRLGKVNKAFSPAWPNFVLLRRNPSPTSWHKSSVALPTSTLTLRLSLRRHVALLPPCLPGFPVPRAMLPAPRRRAPGAMVPPRSAPMTARRRMPALRQTRDLRIARLGDLVAVLPPLVAVCSCLLTSLD